MNNSPFQQGPQSGDAFISARATVDAGLRAHMLRVYNYMTLGLGITGFIAYITANSPLFEMIYGNMITALLVAFAPLAFIFFLNFRLTQMSSQQALLTFLLFSAVMGLSMATIFALYVKADIASAFFITAGTFAATSLWGYTTKSDLTGMGNFMFMGLIGIVIAGIVNIFLGSSMLSFVISVLGVLIFTGLTAYDTQKIKHLYDERWGSDANRKLGVVGALSLYLNFINLFQFILRLVAGGSRR